jgi:hypothetical protein
MRALRSAPSSPPPHPAPDCGAYAPAAYAPIAFAPAAYAPVAYAPVAYVPVAHAPLPLACRACLFYPRVCNQNLPDVRSWCPPCTQRLLFPESATAPEGRCPLAARAPPSGCCRCPDDS